MYRRAAPKHFQDAHKRRALCHASMQTWKTFLDHFKDIKETSQRLKILRKEREIISPENPHTQNLDLLDKVENQP
jgi:hypothetical protein